jgi:hypothetical protein
MGVKDTANLAMIPAAYAEDKVYSVLPSDGDGDFTFTRTGSGTRINKGGYIETMAENVPRLNYRLDADGNVSECAELLLEASRQNIKTYSEQVGSWTQSSISTSSNQAIAPNGTFTADKIIENTATTSHKVYQSVSTTSGQPYTWSVFLKADTRSKARLNIFGAYAEFDITNASVITTSGVTSQSIERYPNGWVRCSITETANSSSTLTYVYLLNDAGSVSYTGDGASGLFVWGGQMELGSTMTSYIPTPSSSAVTRNIDSAYNQPFGDLASDYPITVYWKGKVDDINTSQSIFSIYKNGSAVDYLTFRWANASFIQVERRRTTQDVDSETYFANIGDIKKVAIKFTSATAYKLYIDGIEIRNESSGTSLSWDFDSVFIGSLRVVSDTGKRNSSDELFIWNKALTDAEMVDVTSYDTFEEMALGQQFTIQ